MTVALLQAAGLVVAGGLVAAVLPPRARRAGCATAVVCLLAAGVRLITVTDLGGGQTWVAGFVLLAGVIAQLRLSTAPREAVAGGWRGRVLLCAGPLLCAIPLVGLAPHTGGGSDWLSLLCATAATLLLAALTMVVHHAGAAAVREAGPVRRSLPSPGPLQARLAGMRLALCVAVGFAAAGLGVLPTMSGAPVSSFTFALVGAGALVAFGAVPLQGLALSWLATAPYWLAGSITAGAVGPTMLALVQMRGQGADAGGWLVGACGALTVLLAGWFAASGRASLRDAAWLALTGLIGASLDLPSGPSSMAGAVLGCGVQILIACLPRRPGRGNALAMLGGCFIPAALVLGAVGWGSALVMLAGLSGLGVAALAGEGRDVAGHDEIWRWLVLVLLLGGALLLPASLGDAVVSVVSAGSE